MQNQRWNNGHGSWRPSGELINPRQFEVAEIPEAEAKSFVVRHHYSGTYPAARFRVGLFRGGELVGVAVFSHPCSDRVITKTFPFDSAREGVELGRFVLLDCVAGNGETWFLARCFEILRKRNIAGVVSFSDPMPRHTLEGKTVLPGHVGTIYQAHNALYLGRGGARTLKILPDGRSFHHRAESKIRNQESGWKSCMRALVSVGAEPLRDGASTTEWLAQQLAHIKIRRVRHGGNHKYAWPLDRRLRRHLSDSLPYPKAIDAVA